MLTRDAEFRTGDSITVLIKNRPYVDFEVPPDLNDFRNCDATSIKIYDPDEELIVDDVLRNTEEPGWYYYRYQTSVNDKIGLYKIVVELQTEVEVGSKTTAISPSTTGTTGTSGVPETTEMISDVQIRYFRLNSREVF
jgi:hypothetical protein